MITLRFSAEGTTLAEGNPNGLRCASESSPDPHQTANTTTKGDFPRGNVGAAANAFLSA